MFAAAVLATAALQYRLVKRLLDRQDAAASLAAGQPAPSLATSLPNGSSLRLEDLKGKIVIVSFWASWCLPCRAEMPELASFTEEWNRDEHRDRDLVYVAVDSAEGLEDAQPVLRNPAYRNVLFGFDPDGEAARLWRVTILPSTFVISPEGEILEVVLGFDPQVRLRLHAVLRRYRRGGNET